MVVTLDVSKLSGWLNADACCRVERRSYETGPGEVWAAGEARGRGVWGRRNRHPRSACALWCTTVRYITEPKKKTVTPSSRSSLTPRILPPTPKQLPHSFPGPYARSRVCAGPAMPLFSHVLTLVESFLLLTLTVATLSSSRRGEVRETPSYTRTAHGKVKR